MALARVRVGRRYFCSLGLYTIQLRKKDVLALARVRVSSQYFPVLVCLSYSYARRTLWLSLEFGLAVSIFSLGLYTIQLHKKEIVALIMVRVSSQYFPVLDCISYSTQEGLRGSR